MDSLIFLAKLCPSLPIKGREGHNLARNLHFIGREGHNLARNFPFIGREGHNLARNIKESIYIRVNNPTLNNNIDKYNLSRIRDRVLLNTKGLTLNKQGNNNIN